MSDANIIRLCYHDAKTFVEKGKKTGQFAITATTHLKLLGQLPLLKLYTLMSKSCLLFSTITLTVRFQSLFAHF